MKTALLSLAGIFLFVTSYSQEGQQCQVIPLPLQGTYTGDCSGKKAHGQGKAVGQDTYEGAFKKGYPDGEGTYTWSNGDYFKGSFKKGMKNGKGEMHFKKPNTTDSVVNGYWKNDVYTGLYEKPYEVLNMPGCISHNLFQKQGLTKNKIFFRFEAGIMGTINIDNFQVRRGRYFREMKNTAGTGKVKTIEFQDVEFPFCVAFNDTCGGGQLEIVFYENGDWQVEIVF